jgi:hypothetical protein
MVICLAPLTWGLLLVLDFSAGNPHARATCNGFSGEPGGKPLAPGQPCVVHRFAAGGYNTTTSYAQELRDARAGHSSDIVFGTIVLVLTAGFAGVQIVAYTRARGRPDQSL